ncbi:MAG TPA: 1,4-dihydroxy-6-naphthoate synthase [Syntrophobacteraceae bacterium]|nr:1,4-dihydroxy-6-naphthoate synthase [Syntrophobacteraceae bacterium]
MTNLAKSTLSLGYSPCPNDTFIFHALAHRHIDCGGLSFEPFLADVEALNQRARQGTSDITKVSINAVALLLDDYWLLRAGGALGRGCGPLVVAGNSATMTDLRDQSLAIPGRMTTAHLLLQLHGEHRGLRVEMPFDQIMPAIQRGDVAGGVVIHEGRFTYATMGLHLVLDLGTWWEEHTGLPLPLGGIVIQRRLGTEIARQVDQQIRNSLRHAYDHRDEAWSYIVRHAQEMDEAVIQRHIDTFVNDYSFDVGPDGEQAVRTLLKAAGEQAGISVADRSLFWTDTVA